MVFGPFINSLVADISTVCLFQRHYGSRESVSIPVSPVGSLDLSADTSTVIRPVHSSILGEKYCFEVHFDLCSLRFLREHRTHASTVSK